MKRNIGHPAVLLCFLIQFIAQKNDDKRDDQCLGGNADPAGFDLTPDHRNGERSFRSEESDECKECVRSPRLRRARV